MVFRNIDNVVSELDDISDASAGGVETDVEVLEDENCLFGEGGRDASVLCLADLAGCVD